jgi:nucleoid-associated protein YgaU
MNINSNEPPNGDFVAYVEALVKQASRTHAAQRHDLVSPSAPAKPAGRAKTKPTAKPNAAGGAAAPAQAVAQAVLQAARETSADQAIEKLKGWLVKGAIGAVALFVLLPMLIHWWDRTEDPSALGVVVVLAAVALRWWLAARR